MKIIIRNCASDLHRSIHDSSRFRFATLPIHSDRPSTATLTRVRAARYSFGFDDATLGGPKTSLVSLPISSRRSTPPIRNPPTASSVRSIDSNPVQAKATTRSTPKICSNAQPETLRRWRVSYLSLSLTVSLNFFLLSRLPRFSIALSASLLKQCRIWKIIDFDNLCQLFIRFLIRELRFGGFESLRVHS